MLRPVLTSLGMLVLALSGCAQQQTCVVGRYAGSPVAPLPRETRTERGSLSVNLSTLPSYGEVDRILGSSPVPVNYRVLRSDEVQCLAAQNAPLAKLYDSESAAIWANLGCRAPQAACVQSRLMAYRAVDERNKAAGTALELFYELARAEANLVILDRGVDEIDRSLAHLDQLKASGLDFPMDPSALRRQKLDWLDRRIQLNVAMAKMRGDLQQMCGFEVDPTQPIWPEADLSVSVVAIDPQAAIEAGLANRADLGALRMLSASLDIETLSAARSGMQAIGPGLGATTSGRALLGGRAESPEECQTRQSQLCQATCELERTIAREIGQSVLDVEARLRATAVAKERSELWRQRYEQLQANRATGGATAFDLSAARLERLGAESNEVDRVVAWKIAQAKLKQAQGLLAAECGYGLPKCCP